MLYSSCKEPLIAGVEQDLGIKIAKKVYTSNLLDSVNPSRFEFFSLQVEIDSGNELSEAFLLSEVHPPTHAYKPKFMKPQPPGGRRRSKSPHKPGLNNGDNGTTGDD